MIRELSILWATLQICFAENSYLASFPNALIPGIPLNVRVQILQSAWDVNVHVRLEHSANDSTVREATRILQQGKAEIIPLEVPMELLQSDYKVKVTGTGGLVFTNESKIHFEADNLHIFIQTDKSRYSAGQTVLYRAIFLLPNLMGYNGTTFISITDGKNNRVHFDGPMYPKDGVISGTFTLSREPNFGDWTFTASAKDKHVSKGITVNDYVLPKFIVDITLDKEIKQTDQVFHVMVSSMFTFKTDVHGSVTLQIYNTQMTQNYVEYTKQILGSANFTIQLADLQKLCLPCEINIRALVTDNATALTMATERELTFTADKHSYIHVPPISIQQLYPQNYFVPGLKYYSTIFVGRDDEPLGISGKINVTATITTSQIKPCVLNNPPTQWLDVQTSTLNPFFITFDKYGVAALQLQLSTYTESADIEMNYGSAFYSLRLKPAIDPVVTMMRIYPDTTSTQPGDTITFQMESTKPLAGPLQIEVFASGSRVGGQAAHLSSQNTAQFMVDVTGRMVPDMYVLATHVTTDGVLISDEAHFKVHGLPFLNKVDVSFDKDVLEPGQTVHMTLSADPNSTVYVLSEDGRNRLLGSENDIYLYEIRDEVINTQYNTENNIANYPKRKRTTQFEITTPATKNDSVRSLGSYSDTDDMLIRSGVIVLADVHFIEIATAKEPLSQTSHLPTKCILITTTPSFTYAWGVFPTYIPVMPPTPAPGQTFAPNLIPTPAPGQTYAPGNYPTYPGFLPTTPAPGLASVNVLRSRFPETWLWTEYKINSSGKQTVTLTVPDSMTSWVTSVFATNPSTGFGITDIKPKITVKKPFFVTMDLPDSILLGEEFLLQITAFNYLSSRQQVFLQITTSDKPNVPIPASTVVQPGQGHSTYVRITPTRTGPLQIDVVAKAGFFSTPATDHLIKNLTVMPSGVQKEVNTAHLVSVSASSIFTDTVLLTDPPNMVSGTKRNKIRITGNFMVPSIDGLQNLIRMPYGCGEQTMLNFAPDIYITKYLQAVGKLTADVEHRAKGFLKSGLQRELTYQHLDGSFSAFGDRDSSGSSWLTAFVLKCFRQADGLIQIDEAITASALKWLLKYQQSSGAFYEPGRIIHTQMQAGTSSGIKLTAFILISVLENRQAKGANTNTLTTTITRGRSYLESQLNRIQDGYTLSIVCYALAKAGSAQKSTCFTKLKLASTLDGEKMYWIHTARITTKRTASQLQSRAVSADIEATSYALLSYIEMGKYADAFPIVKWLVGQRNPSGGFQSTQDTVVSLQALAAYSSFASNPPSTYSVTFNAYSGAFYHSHSITSATMDMVHEFELPDSSPNVLLQGMGSGIAVVDVITTYYVVGNHVDTKLTVTSTITKESLNSITVTICVTWKDVSASGMLVAEVETPTGFSADSDELKKQATIKRHESNGRKLAIYLDGLAPRQSVCVDVKMNRRDPVVKSQACHITVYDYYQPTTQAMIRYESGLLKSSNICDVCPLCGFCQGSGIGVIG